MEGPSSPDSSPHHDIWDLPPLEQLFNRPPQPPISSVAFTNRVDELGYRYTHETEIKNEKHIDALKQYLKDKYGDSPEYLHGWKRQMEEVYRHCRELDGTVAQEQNLVCLEDSKYKSISETNIAFKNAIMQTSEAIITPPPPTPPLIVTPPTPVSWIPEPPKREPSPIKLTIRDKQKVRRDRWSDFKNGRQVENNDPQVPMSLADQKKQERLRKWQHLKSNLA